MRASTVNTLLLLLPCVAFVAADDPPQTTATATATMASTVSASQPSQPPVPDSKQYEGTFWVGTQGQGDDKNQKNAHWIWWYKNSEGGGNACKDGDKKFPATDVGKVTRKSQAVPAKKFNLELKSEKYGNTKWTFDPTNKLMPNFKCKNCEDDHTVIAMCQKKKDTNKCDGQQDVMTMWECEVENCNGMNGCMTQPPLPEDGKDQAVEDETNNDGPLKDKKEKKDQGGKLGAKARKLRERKRLEKERRRRQRENQKKGGDDDELPPKKRKQQQAADDEDPVPRKKQRVADDEEDLPPKKKKVPADDEELPPKKKKVAEDDEELPPKKKKVAEGDDAAADE